MAALPGKREAVYGLLFIQTSPTIPVAIQFIVLERTRDLVIAFKPSVKVEQLTPFGTKRKIPAPFLLSPS